MSNDITIENVRMSLAAAQNVEAVGCHPSEDVERVRAGLTRAALLAECLEGADDGVDGYDDYVQGWSDYVDAVVSAADR